MVKEVTGVDLELKLEEKDYMLEADEVNELFRVSQ